MSPYPTVVNVVNSFLCKKMMNKGNLSYGLNPAVAKVAPLRRRRDCPALVEMMILVMTTTPKAIIHCLEVQIILMHDHPSIKKLQQNKQHYVNVHNLQWPTRHHHWIQMYTIMMQNMIHFHLVRRSWICCQTGQETQTTTKY